MNAPTYENRFNVTTLVAAANLALVLVGGGVAYQSLRGEIQAGQVADERVMSDIVNLRNDSVSHESRIRALELGAGRTDEKLTNIHAVLSRIERQLEERPQ